MSDSVSAAAAWCCHAMLGLVTASRIVGSRPPAFRDALFGFLFFFFFFFWGSEYLHARVLIPLPQIMCRRIQQIVAASIVLSIASGVMGLLAVAASMALVITGAELRRLAGDVGNVWNFELVLNCTPVQSRVVLLRACYRIEHEHGTSTFDKWAAVYQDQATGRSILPNP